MQETGITKIIFRVFQDKEENGGLYFANTQFHTISPSLERMMAEIDFRKVDLCAWMITRNFNWLKNVSLFDKKHSNGQNQNIRKLDIFNPEAIKMIVNIYRELASNRIDCILIQDDFTIKYNEAFSKWGKNKFENLAGVPVKESLMMQVNTPYGRKWNQIKVNQLCDVLKLIVDNCKNVNSRIKVGINIYYETPVYSKRSESWYSHNLKKILASGVDWIYLMSYHRQIKKEMKFSEAQNRQFFEILIKKAYLICRDKLIVKIQIRDWETGQQIPVHELQTYLSLVPEDVKNICFTPVVPDDIPFLGELINK